MPEHFNGSTPQRTHRRRGQTMSKEERKQAQETFLAAFALNANVMLSCRKAGIDRTLVYKWCEHDTEFNIRFKQAELDANDMIRGAIYQRGVQGVEKPALSMGKVVYEEVPGGIDEEGKPIVKRKPLMLREYSDSLLALLAKARMPEFREKQQLEMSGPGGIPMQMQHTHDFSRLSDDEFEQYKLLSAKARGG